MVGVFRMVKNNQQSSEETLKNYAKELSSFNEKTGRDNKLEPNVVLFFSFDVVNSTSYKYVNYYGWAQVINDLFKGLRDEVFTRIPGSEIWRLLGDEAIFIVKIRDEENLQEYVNSIFKIMIKTIFQINEGTFFCEGRNARLNKLQNILSLKAAAWIAIVNDIGNFDENGNTFDSLDENDNIFERYKSNKAQGGYDFFEFLGNDIDAGFRISKQTLDGRFVLSYELAYLISQRTESLSYLQIITYKKLKGVWKDRLYPIIWYHDPQAYLENYQKEIKFIDSFTYDACDENELVKEYFSIQDSKFKSENIRDSKMFNDTNYALNKIKADMKMSKKIERIRKVISNSNQDQKKYIDSEYMQIHCAAVCFKIVDEKIKIIVFKRSSKKQDFLDNGNLVARRLL